MSSSPSQQVLVSRCMRFGLWAMVAMVLCNSALYGRMADIQSTCSSGGHHQGAASWGGADDDPGSGSGRSFVSRIMWGMIWSRFRLHQGVGRSFGGIWWSMLSCYARESGSYAIGLAASWYVILPLLSGGRGAGAGGCGGGVLPDTSKEGVRIHILLDLVLGLGLVGGAAGSYVVACLGGCWVAWLMAWSSWVMAAGRMFWWGEASSIWGGVNVVTLALALPLAAGALPFRPSISWMCTRGIPATG